MSSIRRQLGLATGSLLATAGIWACTGTRHGDGSLTISFAPDMSIRAWGLEDALDDLNDLLADCMAGTFARPCTDAEREDIGNAIERVLDSKDRMDAGVRSSSLPGIG